MIIFCFFPQYYLRSSIATSRSAPNWNNEKWIVLNIPSKAKLSVNVYNQTNKHIGMFEISDLVNYKSASNGHTILDPYGLDNGRFYLSINSMKSSNENLQLPRYTFDGSCRFYRFDTVNREDIESIWKVELRRISHYFPQDAKYQQSTTLIRYDESGLLSNTDDLWKRVFFDKTIGKIRPRAYNYIIDDDAWLFSEIGDRWLTNSEIKHKRLANFSTNVRFAGEFHLRPKHGWTRPNDEWEIVFDNASGTFSPNANLLINLRDLILFNFPQLDIVTYDYKDSRLSESLDQLEFASKKYKYNKVSITRS